MEVDVPGSMSDPSLSLELSMVCSLTSELLELFESSRAMRRGATEASENLEIIRINV